MQTKLKGDIAEQSAVVEGLQRGWGVLMPVGDRLPYDLVFDVNSSMVRCQVKSAWTHKDSGNYVVNTRRSATNQRTIKISPYNEGDFDFALAFIEPLSLWYIFPCATFISWKSAIHLVEATDRQRIAKSCQYRNAWHLISEWGAKSLSS